jgi:hypothetical protein
MYKPIAALLVTLAFAIAPIASAQEGGRGGQAAPAGPIKTARYHVTFVRLGSNNLSGLLYEPEAPGPNARVAVVYPYPRPTAFTPPAEELANRGYRVLLVRHYLGNRRGEVESPLDGFQETSRGISYLRSLPGVERVALMGWGTGARMIALYQDVAEHGPAVCQRPGVLAPCRAEQAAGLAKADGLIMFDPGLGAFTAASDVDPAYVGDKRTRQDLDLYAAANGYDPKSGGAHYSAAFRKRYFAAQVARNDALIDQAVARQRAIGQGGGAFKDDEPFLAPGAVNTRSAASLHRTDLNLLSHTKRPHALLKADGTSPEVIVHSIRPPTGAEGARSVGRCCDKANYTVRRFLANDAMRLTEDYAITEDDILGVDWKSSNTSTPLSAEGVTSPTLVLTMSCFQFVVPSEIVFDHLAATDKTFAAVEGADHTFDPCKPEYGDTKKRAFDFVDRWLDKPGRF